MRTVNIHEAKTQLSRLVEQAAKGESFIIAKAGKPMVKVIPLGKAETGTKSRLGFMSGEFAVPEARVTSAPSPMRARCARRSR